MQIETCWHLVEQRGGFQARRQAVASFNAGSRYRKRGLALIPTKFGIAFTAFFLNQVWDRSPDQPSCDWQRSPRQVQTGTRGFTHLWRFPTTVDRIMHQL